MTAKKILIVEDSLTQATRTQLILQKDGYVVRVANDGEEGIKAALQMAPDLIITDIRMPNIDGYQLCTKLKAFNKTKYTPVIMLTIKGEIMDIIEGLASGADGFITKPFEAENLLERVSAILDSSEDDDSLKDGEAIVANKHQIFELLLNTYRTLSNCDIMGILLFDKREHNGTFILMSLFPIAEEVSSQLIEKVLADAYEKTGQKIETDSLKKTAIVMENDMPKITEPCPSVINVPILISKKPIGMLSATSSARVLKVEDVKLLHSLAVKAANTFDKIR